MATGSVKLENMQKLEHSSDEEMFAVNNVNGSCQNLDTCIDANREPDMFPTSRLIQGHPKHEKGQKSTHLKPVAFAGSGTGQGKPRGATVKAFLNNGRAESLPTEPCTKKLKM